VPANFAHGISKLPVFSWTGGIDPDKDTVYYKVYYGLSNTSLTNESMEIVSAQTCTTATNLSATKQYFWKVAAYIKGLFIDTVESSVQTFTTVDTVPPLLTLTKGKDTIYVGETWTEPGYSCVDGITPDRFSQSNNAFLFSAQLEIISPTI
jgi:hypothetical protein